MPASWQRNLKQYPVTRELQESIQAFRAIDAEIELQPILDYLASRELREAIRKNTLRYRRRGDRNRRRQDNSYAQELSRQPRRSSRRCAPRVRPSAT